MSGDGCPCLDNLHLIDGGVLASPLALSHNLQHEIDGVRDCSHIRKLVRRDTNRRQGGAIDDSEETCSHSTTPIGKSIVLFADCTGNSAARFFKTNVWRAYQAGTLVTPDHPSPWDRPRQISYYHDGVGSSSFRALAIIGGVFWTGAQASILDMYTFLCPQLLTRR